MYPDAPNPHNPSNKEIDTTSDFYAKPLGKFHITQRHNHHSSNKNHQTNTLIYLKDTDPNHMGPNPI